MDRSRDKEVSDFNMAETAISQIRGIFSLFEGGKPSRHGPEMRQTGLRRFRAGARGRVRCVAPIVAGYAEDHPHTIVWQCPACGDNGYISGWQETQRDKRKFS